MKAIVWLWPIIVTLLCASHFVRTAQRGEYGEYEDSTLVQNDFLLEKRIKPSLSIVNPLDVLRQRLMLETARRQQREQNRQVEINRQILKQVGKRKDDSLLLRTIFDFLRQDDDNKFNLNDDGDGNNDNDQRQQQQKQQQQQQPPPQHHQQQARYFYRLH